MELRLLETVLRDMSADNATCSVWNPSSCVGTDGCPPRCPRFIDRHGEPIHVRPMRDADRDSLISFYEGYPSAHRSMLLPPPTRGPLVAWLDRLLERARNFVAFHWDRLIGHVLYSPADAEESELLVFVHPDYHSRGIGTELCRQAIAHAGSDGHEAIRLHVERGHTTAIRVYGRLGFRTVADHGDNFEMRLDLEEPLLEQVQAPPAQR